ncbi:MAG: hypothetical protein WC438_05900 [Candidatus Pacearchaeota archaeon]
MITKITEQQATEMLKYIKYQFVVKDIKNLHIDFTGTIEAWKEKGYIKKSAKEEFEEYAYMAMNSIASVEKLINLARAAIEEEYQRGFAAGSVDKS